MTYIMKFTLFIALGTFTFKCFASNIGNLPDEEKINQLITRIENSNAIFIRNGTKHKPKDAGKHLRYKLKMAKKRFWFLGPAQKVSVQDFIHKIASKSSFSGDEYKIQLPSGKIITTREWLLENLKDIINEEKDAN